MLFRNDSGGFRNYLRENKRIILESSASLAVTIITAVIAGLFLGHFRETLLLIPGLIVLIPGAISMRGTILGAMGSRLGSSIHLGLVKKFSLRNRVVKSNTYATFILSIYLSFILAIYAKILTVLVGIESISVYSLIAISFVGSMISMVILFFIAVGISYGATKYGWDVDNVQAPLVASFGDLVTIPALFGAALLLPFFEIYAQFIAVIVLVIIAFTTAHFLTTRTGYDEIIKQSIMVLSFSAILSSTAGIILQGSIESLALIPMVLVLIPAFVGEGGNIGSIFASRVSTSLHLGLIKPKFKMTKEVETEVSHSYLHNLWVFPVIAIVTYWLANAIGIPITINPILFILISIIAGSILTTLIIIVAFSASIFAFKKAIDPDNVLIPIVASMADVFGVVCLFVVLLAMGVL